MVKSNVIILCLLVLLGGCASKQVVRSQVEEVLKENPQLIFEVLEKNNVELLETVERGIDNREKQKREVRFEKELTNPFKPKIDPSRLILGNINAPVTIVEYSDFLCPYCGKANKMINNMVKLHPQKYRLFYKHLPVHEDSQRLALIYEAIASIDHDKAMIFKNYVFTNQKKFFGDKKDLALSLALVKAGVEPKDLDNALKSKKIAQIVSDDLKESNKFGLSATPTFMVNGVTVRGYVSEKTFEDIITTILKKGKKANDDGEVCEDCLNKM